MTYFINDVMYWLELLVNCVSVLFSLQIASTYSQNKQYSYTIIGIISTNIYCMFASSCHYASLCKIGTNVYGLAETSLEYATINVTNNFYVVGY